MLLKVAICLFGLIGGQCVAQRFASTKDAEAFERAFASEGEKVFLKPPSDLNDAEIYSPHMPEYLQCDACHILTYQFNRRFDVENEKRPSLNQKLPVTDILEAVEEVCSDGFTEIGVKEVDGVKRLSGPGSSAHYAAGFLQGGGLWPSRMQAMCSQLVDEYEEMYQAYKEDKLRMFLCNDPETCYCKTTVLRKETTRPQTPRELHEKEDKVYISEEENETEGGGAEEWIKKEEL